MTIKFDKTPKNLRNIGYREDDYDDRLQMVGQRCGFNISTETGASAGNRFCGYSRHLIPTGANALQLVYAGFELENINGAESPIDPTVFIVKSVTFTGGTGYVVNEIVTFACIAANGLEAVKVIILAVDGSGTPTLANIYDEGLYSTLMIGAQSQASTSGSGTGCEFTFEWEGYALGGYITIEPEYVGNGAPILEGDNAIQCLKKGIQLDSTARIKILIKAGEIWKSDILPIDVPIGGAIGIRTLLRGAFKCGRIPAATNYGCNNNLEIAYTQVGDWWPYWNFSYDIELGASSGRTFQPVVIMGIPKKKLPTIIAIGDSRTVGSASGQGVVSSGHDLQDVDGNLGPFERALSNTQNQCYWPWSNMSLGGHALNHKFNGGTAPYKQGRQGMYEAIAYMKPTAVYFNLNVNDFSTGQSLATVLTRETQMIQELKGLGVKKVFTCTTEPESSSTDNFATLENQTPIVEYDTAIKIAQRNDALVAGTWAPYDFYIDNRLVSESSINSGKWVVNEEADWATADGVHASPYIITLQANGMAAKIKNNVYL